MDAGASRAFPSILGEFEALGICCCCCCCAMPPLPGATGVTGGLEPMADPMPPIPPIPCTVAGSSGVCAHVRGGVAAARIAASALVAPVEWAARSWHFARESGSALGVNEGCAKSAGTLFSAGGKLQVCSAERERSDGAFRYEDVPGQI